MTDYTEQDTERVRQREQAAVGHTRPLSPQPPAGQPAVSSHNNPLAVGLIAIGILVLLGNALNSFGGSRMEYLLTPSSGEMVGSIFFLTLASCFLFFAFWRRIYGLLIPGCILAGFAAGLPFIDLTGGVSFFWGLAAGFLAILTLGRSMFHTHSSWPIYPAVPLFAVGMVTAAAQVPMLFAGTLIWLPLLLIGVGVYLGRRRTI